MPHKRRNLASQIFHQHPKVGDIFYSLTLRCQQHRCKRLIAWLRYFNTLFLRYYDKKKNNCFEFFYKGKGGNGNQFDTASSCLRKCQLQKEENEHTARSFRFESGEYGPRDMVPVDLCQREPPSSFCKTNSGKMISYKSNSVGHDY